MFIISRNAQGRATLQHEVNSLAGFTVCGIAYGKWPRRYSTNQLIPELICKKCRPPRAQAAATVTPIRVSRKRA